MFHDQEGAFKASRDLTKRAGEACAEAIAFTHRFRPQGLSQWYLPADPSTSMASVLTEAGVAIKLAKSLTLARAANIPATRLNELNGTLSSLSAALEKYVAAAALLEKDNRPLKYYKDGRVVGLVSEEQFYNFGEFLTEIYQWTDGVRNSTALLGLVAHDLKAEQRYEQSTSDISRRAQKLVGEIEGALTEATTASESIGELVAQASADRDAIVAAQQERSTHLDEMVERATNAHAEIEGVLSGVSQTKVAVDESYEALAKAVTATESKAEDIDSFHSDLTAVRAEIEALRERAKAGDDAQKDYLARVSELITEAEAMVSGATTAGLAKAFDEERKSLSKGMVWALISFFVGIVFIFLTTILLAAYVFEIPLNVFGYNVGQAGVTPERGDEITLAGVLSRTVILLAPFWLTLFSSRRYRSLFDLRQQYTHKYSMAFSVDGFKQQAPQYAEQMAAWVFHVVAEPPVSVKTTKSMGDNPLPDIQAVIKDQLEKFGILNPNSKGE